MEIERKWIVKADKIPFCLSSLEKEEIEQFYISSIPIIRARKISPSKHILTVKSSYNCTSGPIERNEFECPISSDEYLELRKMSKSGMIKKTRYRKLIENNLVMEIDIFEGKLTGLVYLEIEFDSISEAKEYQAPSWVEKEVTDDYKYSNSNLSYLNNIDGLYEA